MAFILPVRNVVPAFGKHCFVAPNATVSGDVVCGEAVTIWFGAVIRGDVNPIRIGDQTNIQDGAIVHGSYDGIPTLIGAQVTVGHRAIIHGCTIHDRVLIGMGAIVLDEAVVGEGCIVGAGSLVLAGMELEPGYLYAGSPVRKVKPISEKQRETILRSARNYASYPQTYDGAFIEP